MQTSLARPFCTSEHYAFNMITSFSSGYFASKHTHTAPEKAWLTAYIQGCENCCLCKNMCPVLIPTLRLHQTSDKQPQCDFTWTYEITVCDITERKAIIRTRKERELSKYPHKISLVIKGVILLSASNYLKKANNKGCSVLDLFHITF